MKKTSKFLSYILRHHPEAIGLHLDSEGWADVDELLQKAAGQGREIDRVLLLEVVANNDKKRFALSDDGRKICAQQGHSTDQVAIDYPPQEPPEVLYHGTADRFWPSICEQGLLAGSRHHVHLSGDFDTAVKVGQRHGKVMVLKVSAQKMYQDGHRFYLSGNHVWLADHVPPQYIAVEQGSE